MQHSTQTHNCKHVWTNTLINTLHVYYLFIQFHATQIYIYIYIKSTQLYNTYKHQCVVIFQKHYRQHAIHDYMVVYKKATKHAPIVFNKQHYTHVCLFKFAWPN